MRSNSGMPNRQGDVELRFAHVPAAAVNTLAWLGLRQGRQETGGMSRQSPVIAKSIK